MRPCLVVFFGHSKSPILSFILSIKCSLPHTDLGLYIFNFIFFSVLVTDLLQLMFCRVLVTKSDYVFNGWLISKFLY